MDNNKVFYNIETKECISKKAFNKRDESGIMWFEIEVNGGDAEGIAALITRCYNLPFSQIAAHIIQRCNKDAKIKIPKM